MYRLKLEEQFVKKGIPLRLGAETPEEAYAELAAITQWNMAAIQNAEKK